MNGEGNGLFGIFSGGFGVEAAVTAAIFVAILFALKRMGHLKRFGMWGGAGATLLLLLVPLFMACAQMLHGQMLVWGKEKFPNYPAIREAYSAELRATEEADAARLGKSNDGDAANEDEVDLDDLLGSPSPKAVTATKAKVDDLDSLIDEVEGDAAPKGKAPKPSGGDSLDSLIDEAEAEDAPAKAVKVEPSKAPAPKDGLDALIDEAEDSDDAESGVSAEVKDVAIKEATAPKAAAATEVAAAAGEDDDTDDDTNALLADLDKGGASPPSTGGVKSAAAPIVLSAEQREFCKLERNIAEMGQFGVHWMPITMALLLLLSALIATIRRHHISLRSATTPIEDRISNLMQALGNGLTAASSYNMLALAEGSNQQLHQLWLLGLSVLTLVNLYYVVWPMAQGKDKASLGLRVLTTIPLYTYMALISGLYFFLMEDYPSGTAVYLQKLSEFSILYVQVGLYLWTGILLRDTSLGQLFFDLVRPLRPPPELFAVLVVIVAAVPTAYSGASGILVLALGATIYTELRRAGAGQQRALAATAMSGSLGVVLPPCLLVVIVASLNLDVTTDELFHWGWRVFGLTTLLFAMISWVASKEAWKLNPQPGAGAEMGHAFGRLAPYLVIAVAVVFVFGKVFNAGLDEHTAPYVLPVAMMLIIPWDRFRLKQAIASGIGPADDSGIKRNTLLDTGTHIGALLMLMGLSACLGGVIERSEIIAMFPQDLGSPFVAMAVLMVVLVLIGMVMDPYGAVILVSVTLYPIAKSNGIHPLNFWMTALVSFELGYLTPPVALNHLLTRQVVQGLPEFEEHESFEPGTSFLVRHERILLPIAVLATTLLVVAFGPLLWGARAG
ncbi:MAG TPA: transporter [Myxococcales bacterium]|nr:transporter [Myxococcales bacterium]